MGEEGRAGEQLSFMGGARAVGRCSRGPSNQSRTPVLSEAIYFLRVVISYEATFILSSFHPPPLFPLRPISIIIQ